MGRHWGLGRWLFDLIDWDNFWNLKLNIKKLQVFLGVSFCSVEFLKNILYNINIKTKGQVLVTLDPSDNSQHDLRIIFKYIIYHFEWKINMILYNLKRFFKYISKNMYICIFSSTVVDYQNLRLFFIAKNKNKQIKNTPNWWFEVFLLEMYTYMLLNVETFDISIIIISEITFKINRFLNIIVLVFI